MFYYLNGTITLLDANLAVVDCGGVGYACKTTSTTISQLQVGKASKLYTYLHVGEGIFESPRSFLHTATSRKTPLISSAFPRARN